MYDMTKNLHMLEVPKTTYLHLLWLVVMKCMWHYTVAMNCKGCYWHSNSANLHNWNMLYLKEIHLWDGALAADLCVSGTRQHVHWSLVLAGSVIQAGGGPAHSVTAGWQRNQ